MNRILVKGDSNREAIQIELINKYTDEEQKKLGEFGYVTGSKYRVSKIETEVKTVVEIE